MPRQVEKTLFSAKAPRRYAPWQMIRMPKGHP